MTDDAGWMLGRRPFVILGRRLTGRGPGGPPWSEPGAERWFALGAVVLVVGLGVAAFLSRPVGYSIAALGLLAVAYTGVLVALDRDGAARAFVRRFWTEQGITVPAPMIQMHIIGVGMVVVGLLSVAVVLREALR